MVHLYSNLRTNYAQFGSKSTHNWGKIMKILGQAEISKILDIGFDFLFVDSFENLKSGESGGAKYLFDERHKFIKGHFISGVVIPGALILESMLQSMALTIYHAEFWTGRALITNIEIEFLAPLPLQSQVENYCRIIINRGASVVGEVTCSSNKKIVGSMKCTYYSSHFSEHLKKN